MSLERQRKIERSVDSVARIYAVVVGLALSESVKTLIVKSAAGDVDLSMATLLSGLPAFVAFIFTVVPFWHGMNRHLDRCYLEKDGEVAEGAMLFDFSVFFIEASILLVAGWTLRSGIVTYCCLGLVLLIDIVWGFTAHLIHFPREKSHAVGWIIINLVAVLLGIGVMAYPFNWKPTVLMAIAIARSIADYGFGWQFYFPKNEGQVVSQPLPRYRVVMFLKN